MFNSQTYVKDVNDVPSNWIIEYYLKLPYKLQGQSIKLKSIFNPQDTNPSMSIYYNASIKKYAFKCFSTGTSGSAIDLMKHIFDLEFADCSKKIIDDYKEWLLDGNSPESELNLEGFEWKAKDVVNRQWNKLDAEYWTSYNISSKILQKYEVRPINSFVLYQQTKSCRIINEVIYNYLLTTIEWIFIYI